MNARTLGTHVSRIAILACLLVMAALSPIGQSAASAAPDESIDWTECEVFTGLECGTVTVPVDYDNPDAGTIDIAVNVRRATNPDERVGYLFVNPGGPGGSGLNMAAFTSFSKPVRERLDIIGFDPRGVGQSEPKFNCGEPGEQRTLQSQIDGAADTPEEQEIGKQAAKICLDSLGEVAGQLGTDNVARDMDEIRKALGAEQINYYGQSYGSTVGVWYATLFPDSVRSMVLDGAVNSFEQQPSDASIEKTFVSTAKTLETAFEKVLAACDSEECPIFNNGDPEGFFREHAAKLSLVREAMDGPPESGFLALYTVLGPDDYWPLFWEGIAELADGNPDQLARYGEIQFLSGDPKEIQVTRQVNCLDSLLVGGTGLTNVDLDGLDPTRATALLEQHAPLLALTKPLQAPYCEFLDDVFDIEPFAGQLNGGDAKILVIGNPSDPKTSFVQSKEVIDDILTNGVLLEADHPGHTVYLRNDCVDAHVDKVLVNAEYPPSGTVCERQVDRSQTEEEFETAHHDGCLTIVPLASKDSETEICDAVVANIKAEFSLKERQDFLYGRSGENVERINEIMTETFAEFGIEL